MRNKKNKLLGILLTLSVLISVVYFENYKTDSASAYTPAETTNSYISSVSAVITGEHVCTTEMLGIHGSTELGQLTIPSANQKSGMKLSIKFLCQNIVSFIKWKPYTNFKEIQVMSGDQDELVTNYIHKSDGKKRIS